MKIKFSLIVLILSLSVAGCAAYFSVWGLSQLFAGASTSVIIMASILEIGKIVSTTALHRYWDKLATGLRTYLTISVIVLMIITSAGIYGFLSNAYQKTANKLEIHEGEVGVLESKKKIFQDAVVANNKIIDSKNKRIDQLSGLRSTQESRIDASKTRTNTNQLRNDINSSNTEIQNLSLEIDKLNTKNSILNDSISKYETKKLEVKSSSDVAGEVGPLKYISELTGSPMDKVVNYMILLLIFVFDPLAIALVLITNKIYQIENETDAVNDVVNESFDGVNDEDELESFDTMNELIEQEIPTHDEIMEHGNDIENGEVLDEEKNIENITKSGKNVSDVVKEIKERRGYSVKIPEPKSNNSVQRIGNKLYQQNGDNNRIIYKKDGNR